jgi:hypothetical protein
MKNKAPPFGGKKDKEQGMKEGGKADKKADAKQGKKTPFPPARK